ncbi:hypothetical protein CCP3SC5AM1_1180002 [Gammaproteobacteria bacterium]
MPRSAVIPRNIHHSSPDYPVLTGGEARRDVLLTCLVAAWHAGQQVLGLYGPVGIGKTTATLQAATAIHEMVTHTLWLELRICPDAGGLLSQLADCLQEIGHSELARQLRQEIQPALQPLTAALLRALGPNCLLIIDQCETVLDESGRIANPYLRELLAALLGHTGWRGLFAIRGAREPSAMLLAGGDDAPEICRIQWFAVEELSRNERATMLRLALPHSPLRWDGLKTEVKRLIIDELAGHPYIFRLFLADPGDDPALTVAEIQNRAAAGAGEYAALDYYVGRVSPMARPMLELLAALEDREPWPFLEGAWRALGNAFDWPERQAGVALSELIHRALVEEGGGGYRILPVLRHYLSSCAPPLGFPESRAKLFHYHLLRLYEVLAKQVKDQTQVLLVTQNDPKDSQRGMELVRYHAVLRDRALRQALHRGNLRLARGALEGLVEPIPWRLTTQFTAERCLAYTRRLTALVEEAVVLADNSQPIEIGACYHAIGRVCEEIQAGEQALTAYQRALNWWERTRQPHRMGDTWMRIGMVHTHVHRWSAALAAYRTALDWWERTRQYPRMGGAWDQIGQLYANQDNWLEALTAYQTALDWQKRTHRQGESIDVWRRVGEIHEMQGQFGPATLAYTQALETLNAHESGSSQALEIILDAARRLLTVSHQEVGQEELERLSEAVHIATGKEESAPNT